MVRRGNRIVAGVQHPHSGRAPIHTRRPRRPEEGQGGVRRNDLEARRSAVEWRPGMRAVGGKLRRPGGPAESVRSPRRAASRAAGAGGIEPTTTGAVVSWRIPVPVEGGASVLGNVGLGLGQIPSKQWVARPWTGPKIQVLVARMAFLLPVNPCVTPDPPPLSSGQRQGTRRGWRCLSNPQRSLALRQTANAGASSFPVWKWSCAAQTWTPMAG